MSDSTAKPLMLHAAGRAFLKVGAKNNNLQMLESGQRLLALSQQQVEGPPMSEKQSDIVERLRMHAAGGIPLADPLATLKDCVKAADEIEKLRTQLVGVEALIVDQHERIERLRGILMAL